MYKNGRHHRSVKHIINGIIVYYPMGGGGGFGGGLGVSDKMLVHMSHHKQEDYYEYS